MTLTLDNISKRINKQWIINDLSVEVLDGECVAILGPSGCGKSTTLRLIAGLEKLDSGKIIINGQDIGGVSPDKREVAMVFQSYALYPHLTIYKNLSLGLEIRGFTRKIVSERVSSVLSIMQLDDLSRRYPSQISGGQRQRVALARALLRDPEIYLLDEPMSNLDAKLREELRPELRKFIKHGKKPVLYVTHDQEEAMGLASRIVLLNKGKVEQIGTPLDLYQNPRNLFVAQFIGTPQINIISKSKEYITAVRPEHIRFSETGIKCKFLYKEFLGDRQLIVMELNNYMIRILCDSNIKIDSSMNIEWNRSDEHIFEIKSGGRIN